MNTQMTLIPSPDTFPTHLLAEAKQRLILHFCDRSWSEDGAGRVQIWCADALVDNANSTSGTFEEKVGRFGRVHIDYIDGGGVHYICKFKETTL